jgi:DNA-binding MarR family transcriptional regulator
MVGEAHRRPMVASPSVAAPDGADSLADRLHSAAVHLLRRLRRTDPMTGVSAAQLSALSVLMGRPRTVGELAAAEQVQPPTISRLVREMEQAGLVARTRDPSDGRVVWIESTPTGKRVLARGRELRIAALARRIERLAPEDRLTLLAGMDVLDRLLEGL